MDDISYSLEAKPEPSWTMAYKTRKTVNRLERKQLYNNYCYTSQLKYVFWLDENVSRAIGQNYLTP